MRPPIHSSSALLVVFALVIAMTASGCINPVSSPAPSAIVAVPYVPPSPTPMPVLSPTPSPPPATSWNGQYVRLYGNVKENGGDHVIGTIKIYYLDRNYWDENPLAKYDSDNGGAYSLKVRSNVSFKIEVGYLYVGKISSEMQYKRLNNTLTLLNDTRMDFDVMTSNITPEY